MKKIEPLTLGMGDRFAHQGKAQLQAVIDAKQFGIELAPVWNKSNREHLMIKTEPASVRQEADHAVQTLGWKGSYHVDADHIGLGSVDRFVTPSDFFTLDVADFVGSPCMGEDTDQFMREFGKYCGPLSIPGIDFQFEITETMLRQAAGKYLLAIQEAGKIYRYIQERKTEDFITEISVDETDSPQTPVELFLILAMIAREEIPAQTVAPKFTGRFNKGVDYVGNLEQFEKEFKEDLAVITFAIREFGLPSTLKLSIHSGSDKFSIYPIINNQLKQHNVGLHVKTAGTTWLEEVIGLAEAGGDGLRMAKEIYIQALTRYSELTKPYAPVIDIDAARLPTAKEVASWISQDFVLALRHDQTCEAYNSDFRQFIHISFRVAAEFGDRFTNALQEHAEIISRNVTFNLLNRHIVPLFK